jgi:hypothetical protein
VTERQIAKESGYSPGIVHRKLAQGQTASAVIRAGKLRQSRLAAAAALAGEARGEAGGSKRAGETYAAAQARKESALASLRQLELLRKRDVLIPKEAAETEIASICTAIRDAMLGLPTKLCSRLASMTDEKEITKYLRLEIRAELTRVSKQLDGPTPEA